MPTIYHFGHNRIWDGVTREITNEEGAPIGWTFEQPPEVPDEKFATFFGPEWVIIDAYPSSALPEKEVAPSPVSPVVI
jgi:hypothetical protein